MDYDCVLLARCVFVRTRKEILQLLAVSGTLRDICIIRALAQSQKDYSASPPSACGNVSSYYLLEAGANDVTAQSRS